MFADPSESWGVGLGGLVPHLPPTFVISSSLLWRPQQAQLPNPIAASLK